MNGDIFKRAGVSAISFYKWETYLKERAKPGAQNIVDLRTACYSNQWDAVVEFTKKAA